MAINMETRRWWAVGALSLSGLVVGLDTTVLNVALPTLATDLRASTSQLQWFANAYNLVFAAMLLPAGLCGDRYGRKKLLVAALTLFGVVSVGCSYSGTADFLTFYRVLLGLAAAFIFPLSLSVLPVIFDEHERPKAVGIVVTASALGLPLGPIVGGWLLDNFWWGSVFLINVPMVLLAIAAVIGLLPESHGRERPRLDVVGVLVSSLGLVAVTYGAIHAGQDGWGSPTTVSMLIGGAVVLAFFVLWERWLGTRPGGRPLVNLGLFRTRAFSWGVGMATMVSFALFGLLFTVPQYFQAVLGADAMGTGVRLLPIVGGVVVGSRVASKIGPKTGAKPLITFGFLLMAIGLFMGAFTSGNTGYGYASIWITVVGLGIGFSLPPAVDLALGSLPNENVGVGSAVVQTVRQVGGTIGVAVLGTLLSNAYHGRLNVTGLPGQVAHTAQESVSAGVAVARALRSARLLHNVSDSFVHGMDVMLWVCGGLALLGSVLALAFVPRGVASAADAAQDPDGIAGAAEAQAGSLG